MSARGAKKGEAQSCVPEQSSPPSLPAPDVKKFQQRVADLSVQIRDEENKRKRLTTGGQNLVQLNGELARVTSELTEIGHLKTSTTAEVREAEEQIKKLGPEIISKKEEANKVLVGLRYKTPERIEEALR
jgi:predicted  nucleic acid-binding Zn-ribbon protein